ncbi:MAG TPA: IclR family transcriptional regulator C-terminal domain-containing protein [Pseudonocardia sp.]|uniref:IclR family transcriptional regulator domain-containing protein n=1 Tax=Pseudonocardia sp. TaxID=60912 RepID=UPI002BCFE691|nr:IclR family transcriptional regulator C-terminal domain-containing protein [Pseudonocardia sp.]HTF50232.1 IclR family transcriptional regulator C-terminal domain-containing protein [Pseudonocardia sp.]
MQARHMQCRGIAQVVPPGRNDQQLALVLGYRQRQLDRKRIRAQGYATNHGEWRSGVGSIAAVIGDAGVPIASLSVNLPVSRLRDVSSARYGAAVREAAHSITSRVRHTL